MKNYLIMLCVFIFFTGFSQKPALEIMPSDGCVYIHKSKNRIIILDELYSDFEIEEDSIVFNETSLKKYNDFFSRDNSKKHKYFMLEKTDIFSDDYIPFSEVILYKDEPLINSNWTKINFNEIGLLNEEYDYKCDENTEIIKYNKSILFNSHYNIIFRNNNNEITFKVISNDCTTLFNEEIEGTLKVFFYDKKYFFIFSNSTLYILGAD